MSLNSIANPHAERVNLTACLHSYS